MLLLGLQAGKGRTGLMVSSYLAYTGMSAEKAMQVYAERRTTNNEGVSLTRCQADCVWIRVRELSDRSLLE